MKQILFFLLFLSLLSPVLAHASILEVSEEHLKQLEEMHSRAESQVAQNDFNAAVKTYEDILLFEPDDETAFTNLGRIYMIQGQTAKAEMCFQNALYINPENESAILGLQKIKDPDSGFVITEEELNADLALPPTPVESKPEPSSPISTTSETQSVSFEKQVQTALKNAGLYQGAIDGVMGRGTFTAIVEFQKIHGLQVDGKAGPQTWAKLKNYYALTKETKA